MTVYNFSMPELPEVTTIVAGINKKLVGKRIGQAKLTALGENLRIKSKQDLDQKLTGKKIEGAKRRAKFLILELSNGDKLIVHLKLTGQFLLRKENFRADDFTRLVLDLDNGEQVRFCDRNGAAEAFIVDNLDKIDSLVGPEPFEITVENFEKNIKNTDKRTIKEIIVDQKVIAGVGNIYADEALYVAKISPFRSPKSLKIEEAETLLNSIKQVLQEGINHLGTTIDSYRDLDGNPGTHQNYLRVYGKGGKSCQNCGTPIILTELGGRRTHYCPNCQPEAQLSLF